MADISAHTIFAEHVRRDVYQKYTIIGAYGPDMVLPEPSHVVVQCLTRLTGPLSLQASQLVVQAELFDASTKASVSQLILIDVTEERFQKGLGDLRNIIDDLVISDEHVVLAQLEYQFGAQLDPGRYNLQLNLRVGEREIPAGTLLIRVQHKEPMAS